MRFIVTVVCYVFVFASSAQSEYIDSLKQALTKPVKNDTMRAFQYNELAWSYLDLNIQKAGDYQQKGYSLSKKINYLNGVADAMNTKGIILRIENKPKEAIKLYNQVIEIRKKQHNESKLIGAYSNLGSVYFESGDNAHALKFYEKAFELSVKLKEEDNQLVLLTNLGVAYKASGLFKQALETFNKGVELNKKLKDEVQEVQLYVNIATVYDERKMYKNAIESNEYAYRLVKNQHNTRMEGVVLYNLAMQYRNVGQYDKAKKCIQQLTIIEKELNEQEFSCGFSELKANFYAELKRYDEALKEINRAFLLSDSITDPVMHTSILLAKAEILAEQGKEAQSLHWAMRGLSMAQSLEDPIQLSKAYVTLYTICKAKGDFKTALEYLEKSNELMQETTLNQVNDQIATLNSLNDLDRKEKDLEIAKQRNEKIESENQRKGALIVGGSIIGFLALILLFLSYRANRAKRKANALLHVQNVEISEQKGLIEEKQKEILDSIHYAKRIQNTLLATEEEIHDNLSEAFIYFQPKDIVSGDFYWCAQRDNLFYLAVCDSTGHGVPGAFMSLLNISFLNEAVNEKGIRATNDILNHVRQRLIANISQDGAQDGMDGVLFCFNKETKELTYSAAYNAPVVVRNGETISFSADKMPIGKGEKSESFTEYAIELQPGDMVYAFSDGFGDQFGGDRGKKFKVKQLVDLFAQVSVHSCNSQYNYLKNVFEDWKGDLEQVDDVTVLGIRFI